MKIVCDNCATKYSIADDKVRGKVFKIRCKKCTHIIVVRGNSNEAESPVNVSASHAAVSDEAMAAEPVGTSDGFGPNDPVWHLVIDREQVGPLRADEVRAKFAAGQIDIESYTWREGFSDWLRLGSIDEFRDLQQNHGGTSRTSAPAEESGGDQTRLSDANVADLFAQAPSDRASAAGDDLFGAAQTRTPASYASNAAHDDMFGGNGEATTLASTQHKHPARVTPGAGVSSGGGNGEAGGEVKSMTGQRNENSVLFSLNNLQALAGGNAPKSSTAEPKAGFANAKTEGSGLIDIRAMAASTLAQSPKGDSSNEGGPSYQSAPPVFSPMAAPILLPAPQSGMPKWLWGVLGLGVLAVAGVGVVIVMLASHKEPPPAPALPPSRSVQAAAEPSPTSPPNPAATAAPGAAPGTIPAPAGTVPPGAGAVPAPGTPAAATSEATKVAAAAAAGGPHKPTKAERKALAKAAKTDAPPAAALPPAAAPAPTAVSKKPGKKGDELDELLSKGSSGGGGGSSAQSEDNLPEQLDRGAVLGGLSKVKPRVLACKDQFKVSGMAMVSLTIGKTGRVSSATVKGSLAGTPTGECISRAVKSASFPPFKGSPLTVDYPYQL